MAQGKRLEVGDELLVWDDKAKRDEFYKRVKEIKKELEEKKFIVFYIDKSYKWHYKTAKICLQTYRYRNSGL